jgi:nitroimidazol reductase NimA-like FMN-containing flavoprotein (pyridoxamine 5'-phosphate oxidase superfamily)
MTGDEIGDLIDEQMMCRIAFNGEEYPYLAPFQYVKINDVLYFHFTDYGRKMKLLKRDNRVCVQVEKYTPDLGKYYFVSLRGKLEIVEDEEERYTAIKKLAKMGREKLSENFLAAHGIDPSKGWEMLSKKQDPVIVKLVEVVDKVGLRSP